MTRYQYGVVLNINLTDERPVQLQPSKGIAETVARGWVISPARTARRRAYTVRRLGWDGPWVKLNTWTTPESAEELVDDGPNDEPEDDEWTNREGMPEFNGSFR